MRREPDVHDAETAERAGRSDASPGTLQLVVIAAGVVSARPLPARGSLTIGRAREADVSIEAASVSRRHAVLTLSPRGATITDLSSANGTSLRGRRLTDGERCAVRPGDAIEVGDAVLVLQPRDATVTASAPTKPPPPGMRADVVVEDDATRGVHGLIARVAPGMINVLLLGETGVGKEVLAERVHRLSPRAAGPFVRLHCAALSENLLESELFGHEKGAFTGASERRVGHLEAANGGTVFFDEVGELPPSVQVKLLRVLEERRVTRVGGTEPVDIDVRVVAATHRDLTDDVARGRFRQDLWYRFNGISVTVPPLRERRAEIAPLARLFIAEAAARSHLGAPPPITAEAVRALEAHPWPGNLRELRNLMERAALLCDGAVRPEHLAFDAPAQRSPETTTQTARALRDQLDAIERDRILDALRRCGGNQSRAAKLLEMPRRTLLARLDAYGVPRPRKGPDGPEDA